MPDVVGVTSLWTMGNDDKVEDAKQLCGPFVAHLDATPRPDVELELNCSVRSES